MSNRLDEGKGKGQVQDLIQGCCLHESTDVQKCFTISELAAGAPMILQQPTVQSADSLMPQSTTQALTL